MFMNGLHLTVYIFSDSLELESCLRKVPLEEDVTCGFLTCQKISEINFDKGMSLIIIDRVSLIAEICTFKQKNVTSIFYGQEEELLQLNEETLLLVDGIWEKSSSEKMLQFYFANRIKETRYKYDAWLYQSLLTVTIDSIPEMVWYKNIAGAHMIVNSQFCKTVHKTKEQVKGKGHCYIWDFPPEEYGTGKYACQESDNAVIQKRQTCVSEEAVKTKDGLKQLRTFKSPLFDIDGSIMGMVGVAHDMTDFSNIGVQLETLIENFPFPLAICDKQWNIVRTNGNFKTIFDLSDSMLDYRVWKASTFQNVYLKKHDHEKLKEEEVVFQRGDQSLIFDLIEREIIDAFGYVSGYYCLFTDVTVERSYEKKIIRMANTDPLTQVYNRRYFYNYMKDRYGKPMTLFYMDLDHFKLINDTYGHQYGDYVLSVTAKQIQKVFPDGLVARMGGDEFIAVLCGKYDISEMNRRARKLAKIERNVFHKNIVSDKKFHQDITISIGIAQTDGTNKSIDALILESDTQMYHQKSSEE